MSGALTLLTGPSGSGKTALCGEIAAAARRAGHDVAGLVSPAGFADGRKTAIEAVDLRTGERRPLARGRDPGRPAAVELAAWSFDDATLAWGNAVLARAVPCDLLVVDELGPLELEQGRGWIAGLGALDSGGYRAALAVVRPALLARARARWPLAAVVAAGEPGARRRVLARLGAADAARDGAR